MMQIKIGDWIITSKGRYGTVIDLLGNKATVKIGNKQHVIDIDQLLKSSDGVIFNVTYQIKGSNEDIKTTIFLKRTTEIFDLLKVNNLLYDSIKESLIKKIDRSDVKLLKITI